MYVAFTKRFILNVGMRHTVVGGRRNRIECHDAIVPGMTVAQIVPGKLNLKPSQIDFFKFNGLGRCRNLPRFKINANSRELVKQRNQVVVNVTEVVNRRTICVIDDRIVSCL